MRKGREGTTALIASYQPRGRVYPGHPRLCFRGIVVKTWVPGTNPGTGFFG